MASKKPFRKQQILEALASMLEANPGQRITTARLAEQVGVSEAALYRHFPSKSKIFEGLLEFVEETLFSRINLILADDSGVEHRCENILTLLLTFTERNPGITRLLTGDALAGETPRLRARVVQLFDRVETQIKQVLREAEMREGVRPVLPVALAANAMIAVAEGRIAQYVRSEFKRSPTQGWPEQWQVLMNGFFRAPQEAAEQSSTFPNTHNR